MYLTQGFKTFKDFLKKNSILFKTIIVIRGWIVRNRFKIMQQKQIDKFLNQINQTSSNLLTKLNYHKSIVIKPSQLKHNFNDESDTSSSATDSNSNFEKIANVSPMPPPLSSTSSQPVSNTKFKKNDNKSIKNGMHLVSQNTNTSNTSNSTNNGQPQKIISIVNERKLSNSSW